MTTGVLRKADVTNHIPQIWSKMLFAQAENLTFWNTMEGPEGSGMPLIRKEDLTKGEGDTIKVDIVLALEEAGQTADTTLLENNEEKLKFRQTQITLGYLKHAVRYGWLADRLVQHNVRQVAQRQLAKWLAGKLDAQIFNELTGGGTTMPTLNKWAAGTATTRATVADTNAGGRLTLDTLTELKAYAQVELKIEPIKVSDGEEYFYIVCHPYTVMSLKRDDTKWAQAQRDAQVRGDGNPLFTGAAGLWDGVIIKTSNRVPRSTNATILVSDNLFLGAQAASRVYGYYPDWTEELFSYGEEIGIATKTLVASKLNVFDLTSAGGAAAADLTGIGAMVVYAAAVAPTA